MRTLAPLTVHDGRKSTEYTPAGVVSKPDHCSLCRFQHVGKGFAADIVGSNPKIALLFPFPTKDEVVFHNLWQTDYGRYLLREFFAPVGFNGNNFVVSHVLRCAVPYKKGRPSYPTSTTRVNCENTCRYYDYFTGSKGDLISGGIGGFNPDLFLITFNPMDVMGVPSYYRQFKIDVAKAKGFVDEGHKPVLLLGTEAATLVYPWIDGNGGAKGWRGHFAKMESWPFSGNEGGFKGA